jgi:hypothetical protein
MGQSWNVRWVFQPANRDSTKVAEISIPEEIACARGNRQICVKGRRPLNCFRMISSRHDLLRPFCFFGRQITKFVVVFEPMSCDVPGFCDPDTPIIINKIKQRCGCTYRPRALISFWNSIFISHFLLPKSHPIWHYLVHNYQVFFRITSPLK